jgi:hypothetical protein
MAAPGTGDGRIEENDVIGPGGRGFGMGWGRGRGRGRGRGWGRGRGHGGVLGRAWSGEDDDGGPTDDDVEGLRAESSRLKEERDSLARRLLKLDKQD